VRIAELSASERTLPQILHLAELLARLIEQPHGSALQELIDAGLVYGKLYSGEIEPLVTTLEQKVAGLASVLALELPEGKRYVDLLVEAHQRLADESLDAAARLAAPAAENELLGLASQLQNELMAATGQTPASKASAMTAGGAANDRGASPVEREQSSFPNFVNNLQDRGSPATGQALGGPRAAVISATSSLVADAGLLSRIAAAVQRCRQSRRPVSLALLEIDRFSDILLELGPAGMAEVSHWLRVALADWTGQRAGATLVSDSCLAIVWEDCQRSEAVHMARQILATVKPWSSAEFVLRSDLTLSCGLATIELAPKNFSPQALLDAAQRCLSGAQLSGGDTVKSISF
jgi:GGDEF domain-containing protein